uniref:non-specific serine/threonine protein kinase n=1 Tax=Kalmanozyma brasiliensis (strain GHG001) TaxID=1365824 RepID=V5EZU8_KALBG
MSRKQSARPALVRGQSAKRIPSKQTLTGDFSPTTLTSSEAQGYYARFFVELKRLGRGARGQVFLCQHVLNGNKLGKFAIKKIPVGDHAQSLLQSLNEVHLMESLHHPNLIHYQHAWIERCQLSAFAPEVPTLFVLMMAANGGSLADWISARAGEATAAAGESGRSDSGRATSVGFSHLRDGKAGTSGDGQKQGKKEEDVATVNPAERLRIERLKAALRQRRANRTAANKQTSVSPRPIDPQIETEVGVHLLREDEIYSLLTDITSGLAFLHDRGILHLDIKPGNVLLHWDEDSLIPRAMLSDFGSSLLLHDNWTRTRSGHTGTMEYMSPETILVNPVTGRLDELSSKADIWSLGMILHLLLFFTLPFSQVDDVDALRGEMATYKGFKRVDMAGMGRRSDGVLLGLLESMLQVDPIKRPSCGEILKVLIAAKREGEQGNARTPHRHKTNAAWPTNTASLLILVLALIGNAAHGPQSVHVRRACWLGHVLLLAWLTFSPRAM